MLWRQFIIVGILLPPRALGEAFSTSSSQYEAPLSNGPAPNVIHGEYLVRLRDDHSLEEHTAFLGTEKHFDSWVHLLRSYWTKGGTNGLLAAIRSDPGVTSVGFNEQFRIGTHLERKCINGQQTNAIKHHSLNRTIKNRSRFLARILFGFGAATP